VLLGVAMSAAVDAAIVSVGPGTPGNSCDYTSIQDAMDGASLFDVLTIDLQSYTTDPGAPGIPVPMQYRGPFEVPAGLDVVLRPGVGEGCVGPAVEGVRPVLTALPILTSRVFRVADASSQVTIEGVDVHSAPAGAFEIAGGLTLEGVLILDSGNDLLAEGGAVRLMRGATLEIRESVRFVGNRARAGGAISCIDPGASIRINHARTASSTDNLVEFVGNRAAIGGRGGALRMGWNCHLQWVTSGLERSAS
jgi:hypothetical protein